MLTPPQALEALLFASGEPLEKKQLAKILELKDRELSLTVAALSEALKDRGIALIETENELELRTVPEAAPIMKKLRESELSRDLGKGSMETLAVIAYQEGATRGEIDWVRGVNSTASLRTLLMRGLIDGKEDPEDRRRLRYTLTTEALAHLGLRSATDLPRKEELQSGARAAMEAAEQAEQQEVSEITA